MRIDFEYGTGVMGAELPDELTDVFIPGKTVPDPPLMVILQNHRLLISRLIKI